MKPNGLTLLITAFVCLVVSGGMYAVLADQNDSLDKKKSPIEAMCREFRELKRRVTKLENERKAADTTIKKLVTKLTNTEKTLQAAEARAAEAPFRNFVCKSMEVKTGNATRISLGQTGDAKIGKDLEVGGELKLKGDMRIAGKVTVGGKRWRTYNVKTRQIAITANPADKGPTHFFAPSVNGGAGYSVKSGLKKTQKLLAVWYCQRHHIHPTAQFVSLWVSVDNNKNNHFQVGAHSYPIWTKNRNHSHSLDLYMLYSEE